MESNSKFLANSDTEKILLESISRQIYPYLMEPYRLVIFSEPAMGCDGEKKHIYTMVNFYPIRSFCTVPIVRDS